MSSGISPVSTSTAAIGDSPHRRQWEHASRRGEGRMTSEAEELREDSAAAAVVPQPVASLSRGESTFATSQFAERMRLLEANLVAISQARPWSPPQSGLSLKDKTI